MGRHSFSMKKRLIHFSISLPNKSHAISVKCLQGRVLRHVDTIHHWKTGLCRVLFIGALGKSIFCRVPHSANQYFAECRTRQNKALGKGAFAECQTLGKAWLSAKLGFAECRGTRQRSHSAKGGRPETAATCRQILPSA